MGKKSGIKISFIYLIGMLLVAIGFVMPMFCPKNPINGKFLTDLSVNGFDFLDFNQMGTITIAGLLIFCGACAGVVMSFLGFKGADIIKVILLFVSIAGGVLLVIKFNDNWLTKKIGTGFFKHAYIGTYMILAGWVVGLLGAIIKK
ncbi:MAG: hypothetical protein MJ188_09230 [Treponema sp.]|nr:hypothetical protein [Treponema sp.]